MSELGRDFKVKLRRQGRWLPWHAHISDGPMILGEPGSSTYASRTPERALEKALRTISKVAARTGRAETISVRIEGWE